MPDVFLIIIPVGIFLALWAFDWMYGFGTGLRSLVNTYPHISSDQIIGSSFTWRADLGLLLGRPWIWFHVGHTHLHIKLFLLPFLFRRSASIPWSDINIEGTLEQSLLPFLRTLEIRIGQEKLFMRLRGRSARLVQQRLLQPHDA